MAQSILVIDFGRYETTAAMVTNGQIRAVPSPATERPALDGGYLRALIDAAQAPIDRLALTIPPGSSRDGHLRLAAESGFPDAELVSTAAAAFLDPQSGSDVPEGGLVLVCDLGVSWSATLLRWDGEQPRQLAEEMGGVNLVQSGTDSALRWLAASCRAVAARAGFGLADVTGVVLAGGGARTPGVADVLAAELRLPVWQAATPEFAVIRGAAAWAAAHGSRRELSSLPATWRVEPLSWAIPDTARLLRWLVAEGQSYPEGARLAQIRTLDDRVYDLTASREGIMVEHRIRPGSYVTSSDIVAMARSAMLISRDRPVKRLEMRVSGEWLLTPNSQYLMECAETGGYVRMREFDSGTVVQEVRPPEQPEHGRIFVHPTGRMALVSWDESGRFAVRDVPSGELISKFQAAARPLSVLVNEDQWCLVSEVDRQKSVGRYRRDTATVWDLDSGKVVEQMVGDDLRKRFTGFVDRTAKDGFAPEAHSPDGRLRVGSTQLDGHSAVWLHRADTDEELFRAELTAARPVRSAFSADGHYLLSNWRSGDTTSCLHVWKI